MVEQANKQYWPLSKPLDQTEFKEAAKNELLRGRGLAYKAATLLIVQDEVISYISGQLEKEEDGLIAMEAYVEALHNLRNIEEEEQSFIIDQANEIILTDIAATAEMIKPQKPLLSRILASGQTKTTEDFAGQNLLNYFPKELWPSVIGQIRAKEDFVEVIKLLNN